MSDERKFCADLAGINAEVIRPTALAVAGVGVATFATIDQASGEPLFGIAIRHADGELLTAILDEVKVHRLAEMMADFVEALPAFQSEARH